jgi:hypothetical protein
MPAPWPLISRQTFSWKSPTSFSWTLWVISKLLINEQHESLGETKSSEALTPFKLPMLRKNLFVCPLSGLIEDRKRKRRDQARRSVKS